jgi:RNA polymerase sigma factor (sigma-70 family)
MLSFLMLRKWKISTELSDYNEGAGTTVLPHLRLPEVVMPTRPEISALLERIARRDETAVQEFGRVYLARFESRARRSGVPVGDREDVAQEIYWAAIRQIQQGRPSNVDAFGTWLERIVQGKIGDYFRALKNKGTLSLSPSSGDDESGTSLVERLAARTADLAVVTGVHEALEKMPADLRMILLLKYYQGLTLKEISKALGKSMSKVYRSLCEAEELFRRLIIGVDNLDAQTSRVPNLVTEGNEHG